jgi:hypothetical protein
VFVTICLARFQFKFKNGYRDYGICYFYPYVGVSSPPLYLPSLVIAAPGGAIALPAMPSGGGIVDGEWAPNGFGRLIASGWGSGVWVRDGGLACW